VCVHLCVSGCGAGGVNVCECEFEYASALALCMCITVSCITVSCITVSCITVSCITASCITMSCKDPQFGLSLQVIFCKKTWWWMVMMWKKTSQHLPFYVSSPRIPLILGVLGGSFLQKRGLFWQKRPRNLWRRRIAATPYCTPICKCGAMNLHSAVALLPHVRTCTASPIPWVRAVRPPSSMRAHTVILRLWRATHY